MARRFSKTNHTHPRHLRAAAFSAVAGLSLVAAIAMPAAALATGGAGIDKSETVYVSADSSGNVRETTVRETLSNDGKAATLPDRSDLSDIKPSDDKQGFSTNADGSLSWTANGKKVSYSGRSDKPLPLAISVSYTLDGRPIEASELAGKSGHLVMRFDYRNESSATRSVQGSQRELFTPFAAITTVDLDEDVFHDVKLTNGRLVSGDTPMAVGYALPGLQESLDLSRDQIELPEHFELEADVTNFRLGSVTTIVTPSLLSDLDTSKIDAGDNSETVDLLRSSMNQLVSGSDELTGALQRISDGSTALSRGVDVFRAEAGLLPQATGQLADGASSLAQGVGQARDGAESLAAGGQALSEGLGRLNGGVTGLQGASAALGASLGDVRDVLTRAQEQASSAKDAASEAADMATQVGKSAGDARAAATAAGDAAKSLDSSADALKAYASAQEGVQAQVSEAREALAGIDQTGMTDAQRQAVASALEKLNDAAGTASTVPQPEDVSAQVTKLEEKATSLSSAATSAQSIAQRSGAASAAADACGDLVAAARGSEEQATGLAGVAALAHQLDQGIVSIHGALGSAEDVGSLLGGAAASSAGAQQLAQALGQAASGAGELATGARRIDQGAGQLVGGIEQLQDGASALATGSSAAAVGSDQLTDGLRAFDEKAVSKMVEALDGSSMRKLVTRLDAVSELADEYESFAGIAEGQHGTTKFVIRLDAIGD